MLVGMNDAAEELDDGASFFRRSERAFRRVWGRKLLAGADNLARKRESN